MNKYSIIFSSRTGNTKLLAEELRRVLPEEDCLYYGEGGEKAVETDLVFAGFWTNQGSCDEASKVFLESIDHKKIFLFGTAGFGENEEYFARILSNVRKHLNSSNLVEGTFMCQGRMPASVRTRYESLEDKEPEKMQNMIRNFDEALSHPDDNDFNKWRETVMRWRSEGKQDV